MILVNHKPQRVRFILDTGPEAAATSSILRSGNTHITKSILQGSMGYQDTILIFQVVLTAGLGSRPGHLMALERQRERERERENVEFHSPIFSVFKRKSKWVQNCNNSPSRDLLYKPGRISINGRPYMSSLAKESGLVIRGISKLFQWNVIIWP